MNGDTWPRAFDGVQLTDGTIITPAEGVRLESQAFAADDVDVHLPGIAWTSWNAGERWLEWAPLESVRRAWIAPAALKLNPPPRIG